MRLSRYFLPVLKETPSEAQIVSHRYMLRAGMIKQSSAGIYSWLPMGFKVLRKLENIVHEEQIRGLRQGLLQGRVLIRRQHGRQKFAVQPVFLIPKVSHLQNFAQ